MKYCIMVVLLSGCGARGYLREDTTKQDFFDDYRDCTSTRMRVQNCLVNYKGYSISNRTDPTAFRP